MSVNYFSYDCYMHSSATKKKLWWVEARRKLALYPISQLVFLPSSSPNIVHSYSCLLWCTCIHCKLGHRGGRHVVFPEFGFPHIILCIADSNRSSRFCNYICARFHHLLLCWHPSRLAPFLAVHRAPVNMDMWISLWPDVQFSGYAPRIGRTGQFSLMG